MVKADDIITCVSIISSNGNVMRNIKIGKKYKVAKVNINSFNIIDLETGRSLGSYSSYFFSPLLKELNKNITIL